jgi:hypothetical protein
MSPLGSEAHNYCADKDQLQFSSQSAKSFRVKSRVQWQSSLEVGSTRQPEAKTVAPDGDVGGVATPIVSSRCVVMPSIVVRQTPACVDVIPGTEKRPLFEDVTQQRSDTVTGNINLCVIVIYEA